MTFGGKDNRGPSIAELQRYIREKTTMVFLLNTGEETVGTLRWFDEHAFSLSVEGEQPFTILRSAVVGYRKKGGAGTQSTATAVAQPAPVSARAETKPDTPSQAEPQTETESGTESALDPVGESTAS